MLTVASHRKRIFRDSAKAGLPRESVFDCLIAILLGGLAGGRLLFVIINWEYYSRHLVRSVMFFEGGLAFQGALAGAVLASLAVSRIKRLPFWGTSDLIAPYIPLGQAVGRIGCFLNGCCYGKAIECGVGVTFPGETVMRIPTQVYSSIFLLALFMFLIDIRKKKNFDGYVFVMYIILYAVFRFFMDFFRGDGLSPLFGFTLSQGISLGMAVFGAAMWVYLKAKSKKGKIKSS